MQTSQQIESTNSQIPLNLPLAFRASDTIEKKSYTPISSCILDYIITTNDLTSAEKTYYILANSLALIKSASSGKRIVTLPAHKWATRLGCSKSEIFNLQESLENKGYFDIARSKNKFNRNNRNSITPTLPNKIFEYLNSKKNITAEYLPFDSTKDSKMSYLDKTKHFFKLNYDLLKIITSNKKITATQKTIWLDLYIKAYNNYKFNTYSNDNFIYDDKFCLFSSYLDLQNKYSCSKSTLSKNLNALQTAGFITKTQMFTFGDDLEELRQDNSIWKIDITLPAEHIVELTNLKDRSAPKVDTTDNSIETDKTENDLDKSNVSLYKNSYNYNAQYSLNPYYSKGISNSDPSICKSGLLLNNSIYNNICNIDYIDANKKNLTSSFSSSFYLSDISISFKNSFYSKGNYQSGSKDKKPDKENLITKPPQKSLSKSLKDFYPLSKDQVLLLQNKSGREFNTNFTNELLLKLSYKYPNHSFKSQNEMMAYMAKVLKSELHNPALVNHESFRLVPNEQQKEDFEEAKKIEKYLEELENSKGTSKLTQLRKKIAAVFEPDIAYRLLTETDFIVGYDDKFITLKIPTSIDITGNQLDILQNQLNAVYGVENSTIKYVEQSHKQLAQRNLIQQNLGKALSKEEIQQLAQRYIANIDSFTIWGKIRKELILCCDAYGQDGIGLDEVWFSKLDAEINTNTGNLIIKAPSAFYRDYTEKDFIKYIEQVCHALNLNLNKYEPVIVSNSNIKINEPVLN